MSIQNHFMSIQYIFEIFGTIVFAISGVLAANRSAGQNWFGVVFVGIVTAIGGGSVRDVLLDSYPLVWIEDVNFIYAAFFGIVLMHFFYRPIMKYRDEFSLFDTLGIALFTVVGTEKALEFNVHWLIAAIMGMFTAVMGGVIRDTLSQEMPIIFKKEVYATACLAGAFLYLLLNYLEIERTFNFIIAALFIILIRILAIKYHWSIPKYK